MNKSSPLASIVIPFHNQEKFCASAVASALNQTYDNCEIIAVDDGSTDKTLSILKKKFSNKILIISQENQGPSAAINAGIKRARGKYIFLCGGDDINHPERIQRQVMRMESNAIDLLFCVPNIIDSNGNILDDNIFPIFKNSLNISRTPTLYELLICGNFLCAPSACIRANTFDQIGYFDNRLIYTQDYDYWLRASLNNYRIEVDEHRLLNYRRHENNLSLNINDKFVDQEYFSILKKNLENESPKILRRYFASILIPSIEDNKPLYQFEKAWILYTSNINSAKILAIDLLRGLPSHELKILLSHGCNVERLIS